MKKLFTFLFALVASVGMLFAAKDVVPSDAVLQNYYEQGQLCVCIFVPAEMACNDVVFVGTYNRDASDAWITDVKTLAKFEPVEGYDGWYVLAVNDETPADFQDKGIQGKPVVLEQDGNFDWAYQVGDVTVIRGGVTVVPGFSGEIDLIGYTKDAPNVFIINALKANANPCTAVYHDYTFTVISDGCDGFAVPYLIGSMTDWYFQQMQVNVEKTQELGASTYYYKCRCAEGTRYQVLSGLKAADGSIAEYPTWDAISYLEQLVDDVWVPYTENGNVDLTTGANVNITFDVRQKNLRWARCAAPEEAYEVAVSLTAPAGAPAVGVEIIGDFDDWGGTLMTLENGKYTATVSATPSQKFKFREAGTWDNEIMIADAGAEGGWKGFPTTQFQSVWEPAAEEGKMVINLDLSNPTVYRWKETQTITGTRGDNLTWEFDAETGVLTISGIGAMADYQYDSPWNGYRSSIKSVIINDGVTSIGATAFSICSSLTSVTIGNSVTEIGDYAFESCPSLNSVTIGDNVTSIGKEAFSDCTKLSSVIIPKSVVSIGEDVFGGSYLLSSISVEAGNPVYDSRDNCNAIIETTTNTIIAGCSNTIIPNSVTAIGNYAFAGFISITSFDIPNQIVKIGNSAFGGCKNLSSVTIPNSVINIGEDAFSTCRSLTTITIPSSVKEIMRDAFWGCSSMSAINFESQIPPTMGVSMFYGNDCSIYVPCGTKDAYVAALNVNNIIDESRVIEKLPYTYSVASSDSTLGSVTITQEPTCTEPLIFRADAAEDYQFTQWSDGNTDNPRTITLTQDTTLKAEFELAQCLIASGYCGANSTNLTWELSCDSVLTISGTGAMEDGECIDDPLGDLPIPDEDNDNSSVIVSDPVKSIIIKEGVTTIGVSAFWGRSSLTSVTIPNTVTSIGNGAFRSCTSLSSVYITDIAAWCRISTTGKDLSGMGINECELSNPFHYADNLYLNGELVTDLVIPNSVTRIEPHVFNSCSCLTSVTIGDSVNSIGDFAFAYCKGLTSVTFGNSVTSIGWQAFDGCESLTSVTIPSSVTSIGDFAFYNCSSLTSVTFEGRTPPLMEYAFYVNDNCSFYVPCGTKDAYVAALNVNNTIDESRVIEIVIASGYCGADSTNLTWELSCDSVLTISGTGAMADYAYASITPWYGHRSAIKTILINDGVTSIGDNAFYGCKSLTSVTIGNSVTSIGNSAFSDCWRLDALQLPESVTSIGNSAFAGCFRFRNIHIPKNVSSIGTCLFQYCSKLVSITVDTENPIYDSRDNCNAIIETSTNVLVEGSNATHIPETVVAIGKSAFANKNGFRQIDIPNSITSIGGDAFINCDTLESLVVPTSVSYMGRSAFYQCSGLKTVEFKSVTPPNIDNRYMGGTCFLGTTCDFLVPCGTKEAYVIALNYQSVSDSIDESRVIESEELMFDYTISSDNTLGSVTITQEPTCTAPLIFRADAAEGYQFAQWSDGNTDNPRSLILTQDTILKALFEQIIIEQDTIIVTDSTDISDIITGGQDTIPYIEVQPDGEITIDITDVRIGVITIVTIGTESGQVHPGFGGNYDNLKNTRVVMEYVLNPFGQTASPDKWYAFAVPFKVDMETGITRKYGNKSHVPGVDFMILEYDSELRSRTGSGWKEKKSGLLEPGHFYMLGIEGNCNRWLFEKVRNADVVGNKEKDLQHYAHGNSKNNGWHGLGNTTLEYVDMSFDGLNATYVYTYDNQYGKYNIYSIEELILAVGQPFFTQGDNDGSVAFTPNNGKGKGNGKKNMPIYAPSYDVQPSHPRVLLTIETEKINATPDRLYITLHDNNQCGSYRIGRDFMRMDKGSKQVPNFWCPMADGTQLSAHGVTMPTTYTTIPLGIYAPIKGEYVLNAHMRDMDDYIVEIYYQNVCLGTFMHDMPLTMDLTAGTSYDYSIRISRRVSTDLNPAEDTQCDKDNKWYDVLGRPLPQDAHGIFIRKGEKIIK